MPRRRETRRSGLDGTPITNDELYAIIGSIGRIWKQYRRRLWPDGLKDSVASVLLDLRWTLGPVEGIDCISNLNRTRSDIRGLAGFLAAVAKRSEVDTSQSAPPVMNAQAKEFIPSKVDTPIATSTDLELHVVAESCITQRVQINYLTEDPGGGAAAELSTNKTVDTVLDALGQYAKGSEIEETNGPSSRQPISEVVSNWSDTTLTGALEAEDPIMVLDSKLATCKYSFMQSCMDIQYHLANMFREFDHVCNAMSGNITSLLAHHTALCQPWETETPAVNLYSGIAYYDLTPCGDVEDTIDRFRSLLGACLVLDYSQSGVDHGGYVQWVEAITESTLSITSWNSSIPFLFHLKHLEKSACDHIEWVLVKWCPDSHDIHDDCIPEEPLEFISDMLGHKFDIESPERVVAFSPRRVCDDAFATPLNICIDSYDEDMIGTPVDYTSVQ